MKNDKQTLHIRTSAARISPINETLNAKLKNLEDRHPNGTKKKMTANVIDIASSRPFDEPTQYAITEKTTPRQIDN